MLRIAVTVVAVIGVIAAFTGVMYLRYSGDTASRVTVPSCCGGVVVAARDIPAGAVIERDMVAIESMPDDKTEPYVYHDTAQVIGQMTKVSFASGEQVVPSKVAAMPPWGTGLSGPPPRQSGLGVGFGN